MVVCRCLYNHAIGSLCIFELMHVDDDNCELFDHDAGYEYVD